jgi:hypothetical protein
MFVVGDFFFFLHILGDRSEPVVKTRAVLEHFIIRCEYLGVRLQFDIILTILILIEQFCQSFESALYETKKIKKNY